MTGNGHRNEAISLGFLDTSGISDAVYADLMAKRIVDMHHLQNLNDFKLLQIGWIYNTKLCADLARCAQTPLPGADSGNFPF